MLLRSATTPPPPPIKLQKGPGRLYMATSSQDLFEAPLNPKSYAIHLRREPGTDGSLLGCYMGLKHAIHNLQLRKHALHNLQLRLYSELLWWWEGVVEYHGLHAFSCQILCTNSLLAEVTTAHDLIPSKTALCSSMNYASYLFNYNDIHAPVVHASLLLQPPKPKTADTLSSLRKHGVLCTLHIFKQAESICKLFLSIKIWA